MAIVLTDDTINVKEKRIIHCRLYTVKSAQVIPRRPHLFKWRNIVLSSAHQHDNDSNNSAMLVHSTRVHGTTTLFIIPPLPEGGGGILFYLCQSVRALVLLSVRPSVRPSKIIFFAFFSVNVDGRNLIFGHKLHIGTQYRGKRFWTHQIPTSCLPTLLIFIHIEHTV